MALLLAKGEDFAAWRGVEEFAVAYRDAAVKLASQRHPEGVAQLLELMEDLIAGVEQENIQARDGLSQLVNELATAADQAQLRLLLSRLYGSAYQHFNRFGSPSAFYSMSSTFLCAFASRCLQLASQQFSADLPPLALITMGPAGRHESTQFCRMQLALVWDGPETLGSLMSELGKELVAWFRVCGLTLEENVTPLNADWLGSLGQWQERFEEAARTNDQEMLIEMLRLADKTVLVSQGNVGEQFNTLCNHYLAKWPFVANLVERCTALSNGIGLMGNLKLEKSGPHRGAFPLLDHALLPLAAAVTAICLMRGVDTVGTPERLRELVRVSKLDVDLAERALQAWHCFSQHRLNLEQCAMAGQDCRDILHLLPATLSASEVERLRTALETVADLQRSMQVCFGAYA